MRLDQMLADICSVNPNLQPKRYQSNRFTVEQIQQDKLSYILTFGGTKTEKDFVENIHRQNPVPIIYLLCQENMNAQQRYNELTRKGIETYHLLNVEDLMMRLLDIGRYH